MKEELKQDIFKFKDYRLFLKDLFQATKKKNKNVSLETLARKIGVSKSYIRYVLDGKRHITLDLTSKIAKAFKLSRQEHQGLIYMVCRDTCQESETKKFFHNVLDTLANHVQQEQIVENLDRIKSNLFDNSLAMVIHSLAKRSTFKSEALWIKNQLCDPTVKLEDINKTLDFLITSKSLVKNETGTWSAAAFVFNTPFPDIKNGFKIYKTGMRSMEAVCDNPEFFKPLTFQMLSLSFDESNVMDVAARIRSCRDDLIKLSQQTTNPKRVVLINLNSACFAKSDLTDEYL